MIGALWYVTAKKGKDQTLLDLAESVLTEATSASANIAELNDRSTHEEVLAAYDKAIELSKQAGD